MKKVFRSMVFTNKLNSDSLNNMEDNELKKVKDKKRMKFSASRKGHSAAKVKFAKPIIVMQSSCCAMVSNPKNT